MFHVSKVAGNAGIIELRRQNHELAFRNGPLLIAVSKNSSAPRSLTTAT